MARDEDILAEAREAFRLCQEAEAHNRAEALDDIRFARLGEQWPEPVRRAREREQRPCLTINRLPAFIRQVVNDARQNKPSIRVRPADDRADPATAEVINGLIRNIEYVSDADIAYDTAAESAVTCGIGYLRVGIGYAHDDGFEKDIRIERVANPFTVYGDPRSTAADSSDWTTAFVTELLPRDVFAAAYKGAEPAGWDAGYAGVEGPWLQDGGVLVAEWWKREEVLRTILRLSDGTVVEAGRFAAARDAFEALGLRVVGERESRSWKVTQRIVTGAEVLEETVWAGRYIPIVPVYGDEVNVEGRRHFRSLVRDAKDPQRMFNYWRTTSTELVALAPKAPFVGPRGAFKTDESKWATANTQSHPYLEYDGPVPPQRQAFAGVPAGALQEALNAADDLKAIMGLHDASLGAAGNETSGRAILARQREGDTATFHFIDNLTRAIRHTGRILLDLIPAVYTGERVVRVLGEDGTPRTVAVSGRAADDQRQQAGQEAGQQVGQQAGMYDLSAGKYDLVVRAGPSFTTKREEAAAQMTELIRAFPAAAPVLGDLLAKNLDWPEADTVAERLQSLLPQRAQAQDPAMAQQIQGMQAEIRRLAQENRALEAEAAIKARELEIKAFEAETRRIEAMAKLRQAGQPTGPAAQAVRGDAIIPDLAPGAPLRGM
ncbi:portal protein [Arenibaculum pallidiluteum]|uniref:portal protein n=1 Tax=Arenibaculum pallidiluteum TaxID=2812559 RepID=UPI001A96FEF7|nr:portal protein [Arenibaculum pallidiluteum]